MNGVFGGKWDVGEAAQMRARELKNPNPVFLRVIKTKQSSPGVRNYKFSETAGNDSKKAAVKGWFLAKSQRTIEIFFVVGENDSRISTTEFTLRRYILPNSFYARKAVIC